MIWDQLLSSWAWCLTDGTHNHTKPNEFAYYGGPYPRYLSKMVNSVVGWQLLLTPWLLSTWFGDWLASQSPNPSWQHRVSLKHLQNTVILCHFVSLLGMLCHLGGWGNGCRHMISTTQNLPKPDKTHGIIDKSGVGAAGQTSSKDSDFAGHNLFSWGLHHTGCCLSTWFLQELSKKGMRKLNNQLPN